MPHSAVVVGRIRPRRTYAYVLGLVFAGLATGQAAAATPPTGGAQAGPSPKLRALICRTACAGVSVARAGSRVRVKGRALKSVDSVVFQGAPGGADDVSVPALRPHKKWVDARVPRTAVSGPVVLVSVDGAESAPSPVPLTIDPAAPPATGGTGDTLGDRRRGAGQPRLLRRRAQGPGLLPRARLAARQRRGRADPPLRRRRDHALGAGPRPARDAADRHLGRHRRRQGPARRPLLLPRLRHLRLGRHRLLRPGPGRVAADRSPLRAASSSSATSSRSAAPTRSAPAPGCSAAAAGTRARTRSPSAGPRSSRPAAASSSSSSTTRARATTSSSTARTRATTTPTCTCKSPRSSTRATTSTPASRSASSATPAAPTAATCTSRSGRRRAGTAAASAIDPLPLLQAWDKTS